VGFGLGYMQMGPADDKGIKYGVAEFEIKCSNPAVKPRI
jgi:hypothetical protein